MKRYIFSIIFIVLASACVRVEEVEPGRLQVGELVRMQLKAFIDQETVPTRTYLDGDPVASERNTFWIPGDSITVAGTAGTGVFKNVSADTVSLALFEGLVAESDAYYALYPAVLFPGKEDGDGYSMAEGFMDVTIPQVQKFQKNTYATDMVPMVAKFNEGENLYFKNVCGGFVIKLTGSETIRSVSFSAQDIAGNELPISSRFSVDMNSESYTMTPSLDAGGTIMVDCGEGVTLNQTEPTAFHILLPPAVYSRIKVTIASTDGQFMVMNSEKELNIRRANITYASTVEFEDNLEPVDLSAIGTANSYIVSEPGVYSFDATVIGNGILGLIDGAGFHTDDPAIAPESVEVIWQDNETEVVSDVKLIDGRVRFSTSGTEGNALIAVKDASGIILWSWHIWITDKPKEHLYQTSTATYRVLNRNIGAIGSGRSEDCGNILYFQWGRKDPLSLEDGRMSHDMNGLTLVESINRPDVMSTNNYVDYQCSTREWMNPYNGNLWALGQKTIYDPCPVGYKVAAPEAFSALSTLPLVYDTGYELTYNGNDYAYFPISGHCNGRGNMLYDTFAYSLTAVNGKTFRISSELAELSDCFRSAAGVPVRCMKDESTNVIFHDIHFSDVTSSSVTISALVDEAGEVLERGFVYGTSSDVTIETGTKLTCEKGMMTASLTGLSESTKYYVRIYIKRPDRTIYSSASSFVTTGSDGVCDLSVSGTSNSYIVSRPGTYKFNATVKGNSTEGFEYAESASVLWETLNTDNLVEVGDVVTDIAFDGTYISFKTPAEFVPGNALIALRDEEDMILWSWHIWVTDQNPEGLAVEYEDGSLVMDRNLGALTKDVDDVRSFGLFYQWGRKDPFVGCGNIATYGLAVTAPEQAKKYVKNGSDTDILSYAISRPSYVIQESKWNSDNTLWRSVKTMYDPCPVGWRVADHSTLETRNGTTFPFAGYTDGNDDMMAVGSEYYVWTVSQANGIYQVGSRVGFNGRNDWQGCTDVYKEHNVRCMKDADFALVNIEILDLTPYSLEVSAEVTVSDATIIEKKGFVISDDVDCLSLDDGVIVVESGAGQGEFSAEIKDLLPNKRYYVRAFAIGGRNIKYGDCVSFMTDKAGNGEDFKDDGEYEWD